MLRIVFFISVLIVALAACGPESSRDEQALETSSSQPLVIASNYPLYYFASRIAGENVTIALPEIEGDPADWKPGVEAIGQLQAADLVLLNGAGYEAWLKWVSLPDDRLLDTSASFQDRLIPLAEETVHQHGPGGEHSHTGMAFTVWLDPGLAMEQARAIAGALDRLAPENSRAHRENLAALSSQLKELDTSLESAFREVREHPLLFSHPVYQYLEKRYALQGISMHWEPEQEISEKAWIDLSNVLRRQPSQWMMWENTPVASTLSRLQDYDLQAVVFRTASNRPVSGDYFDVMSNNAVELFRTADLIRADQN